MSLPEIFTGNNDAQPPAERLAPQQYTSRYDRMDDDRLDFQLILSFFFRRFRLFTYITIMVFLAAAVLTLRQPKTYYAQAEVALNTRAVNPAPEVFSVLSRLPRGDSEVNTELRILRSRDLAAVVVDKLDLIHDPDFNPRLRKDPKGLARLIDYFESDAPPVVELSEEEIEAARPLVIDIARSGLMPVRIGDSYSLRIGYEHSNPQKAAAMANAFAEAYVTDQLTQKRTNGQRTADFLRARIDELSLQAKEDYQRVQQFRIENDMLSSTGVTLTEQDISALNQQLALANAKSAEDEARLTTARAALAEGSLGDNLSESLSSSVVSSLRSQRAALSVKVAEFRGRYGPEHPELQKEERKLADLDLAIQAEIDRIISGLAAQARVSRQRVTSMTASLEEAKSNLVRNNRAEAELNDLQRRAETSRTLYESYLENFKETVAREGIEESDSRILSEARTPGSPSKPNIMFNLGFGAVFGVILGAAVCLITEMNFSGLTTNKEVERELNVRSLGIMPLNKSFKQRKETALKTVIHCDGSPLREAIFSILTSVEFMASPKKSQVIYISSALPGEGKSTFSACLAAVAAQNKRAVVVDCDRMRTGLSKIFDTGNSPGLKAVLEGKATLDQALVYDEESGCAVLPITQRFPRKSRLHHEGAFGALIASLRERFDFVILDAAPILPVSEARELAAYADFVVLAVHWRKTSRDAIRETIRLLPARVRDTMGVVLTQVNAKRQSRFAIGDPYYYYHRYKDYYKVRSSA